MKQHWIIIDEGVTVLREDGKEVTLKGHADVEALRRGDHWEYYICGYKFTVDHDLVDVCDEVRS